MQTADFLALHATHAVRPTERLGLWACGPDSVGFSMAVSSDRVWVAKGVSSAAGGAGRMGVYLFAILSSLRGGRLV